MSTSRLLTIRGAWWLMAGSCLLTGLFIGMAIGLGIGGKPRPTTLTEGSTADQPAGKAVVVAASDLYRLLDNPARGDIELKGKLVQVTFTGGSLGKDKSGAFYFDGAPHGRFLRGSRPENAFPFPCYVLLTAPGEEQAFAKIAPMAKVTVRFQVVEFLPDPTTIPPGFLKGKDCRLISSK